MTVVPAQEAPVGESNPRSNRRSSVFSTLGIQRCAIGGSPAAVRRRRRRGSGPARTSRHERSWPSTSTAALDGVVASGPAAGPRHRGAVSVLAIDFGEPTGEVLEDVSDLPAGSASGVYPGSAGHSGRHARAQRWTTATGTATRSVRARTRPNDGGRSGFVTCVSSTTADDGEPRECDWGSRGRRFKSCQPDSETVAQRLCPERSGTAPDCFLRAFGHHFDHH